MQPEEIITLSFTNKDSKVIREKVRACALLDFSSGTVYFQRHRRTLCHLLCDLFRLSQAVAMMRRSGYFDQQGGAFDGTTVAERVDDYRQRLWAGTFHSFSSAIIRRYGDDMLTSLRVVSR